MGEIDREKPAVEEERDPRDLTHYLVKLDEPVKRGGKKSKRTHRKFAWVPIKKEKSKND